ncbi:prolyl oligopeptidase family serine peptidase [Salinicoccus hispanicus]|uniref:Prolyl oligopeptidase family serine peptidase n=2 Tax=Salinicoccus hispanicus TaxID=157225 RepID=A0A6N8TY99_9STAP|nr:prolyl oligopeptidase family serine peptidase [Salinicoccus hispanicus]MXQ50603.1 prolyl oligopeptidase family serine peptidase [Salinicoccus hispanicus]
MNLKYHGKEQSLYFISSESGTQQLWKMEIDSREKYKLTDSDQNIKNFWIEEDHITVATDYHGNERNQFHKFDGKDMITLVDQPDCFHHYGEYDAGKDMYTAIRNHHASSSFELCSIDGAGTVAVMGEFEAPIHFIHELSEGQLLLSMDVNNVDQMLMVFDTASGEVKELPFPQARFSSFKFVRDTCLCLSDLGNGFKNIYEIDLEDGTYVKRTGFNWDIEHFKLSKDDRTAILSCNENGSSLLYTLDLTTWEVVQMPFKKNGVIHSLSIGRADDVFLIYSSVDQPHCIYRYSLDRKDFELIADNLPAEEVSWRMASYSSFDGTEIPYFIYEAESGHGAVIHIHGGPESQARPEFNALYHLLNRAGLCVAVPNIRGSMGYGRTYLEADDREKRLDAMKDVVELRQHLIDTDHADSANISVMGRSYGGLMTLLLVTHHPDLWTAAVDIVGISHLRTFLLGTPPWRRSLRAAEYGSIEGQGEFLDDISPLTRSRDITAPLMIFHSHHDSRVPYTESVQMAEALAKSGQDAAFTAYENEGHTFMHQENIDDMNRKIAEFLIGYHTKG